MIWSLKYRCVGGCVSLKNLSIYIKNQYWELVLRIKCRQQQWAPEELTNKAKGEGHVSVRGVVVRHVQSDPAVCEQANILMKKGVKLPSASRLLLRKHWTLWVQENSLPATHAIKLHRRRMFLLISLFGFGLCFGLPHKHRLPWQFSKDRI